MAARKTNGKVAKRRRKTPATRTAQQILLDGTRCDLMDGSHVMIRPWGLELRESTLPVIADLVHEMRGAGSTVAKQDVVGFLLLFTGHCDRLLQMTLGWDHEQIRERLNLEDHMKASRIMMETCVIREDGSGPLGEYLRLYGVGSRTMQTVLSQNVGGLLELATTDSEPRQSSSSSGVRVSKRLEN